MPVAAPADRRFKRKHVSPGRRRRGRRALWAVVVRVAVVVVVAGLVGWRLGSVALSSEALTVSAITVSGNEQLSGGEVLALLADMRGANLVTVDLRDWRERLLTLPWVEDATLRRVLPGTVAVTVTEREPMAVARVDGALYLIDWRGEVIDEFGPNYEAFDLPLVDGIGSHGGGRGPDIDPDRAALAARLFAAVRTRPSLAERISQVDVADVHNAEVILEGDTALVRVGEDRFVERLESYLDLVPALRERVPDIDYVDLRFDERVYVRPLDGDGLDSGRGPSGS